MEDYDEAFKKYRLKMEQEKIDSEKRKQEYIRREQVVIENTQKWTDDIIPDWSNKSKHQNTIKLCWMGLPPKVRSEVWMLSIGNRCDIDPEMYAILLARAQQVKLVVHGEEKQKQADFIAAWEEKLRARREQEEAEAEKDSLVGLEDGIKDEKKEALKSPEGTEIAEEERENKDEENKNAPEDGGEEKEREVVTPSNIEKSGEREDSETSEGDFEDSQNRGMTDSGVDAQDGLTFVETKPKLVPIPEGSSEDLKNYAENFGAPPEGTLASPENTEKSEEKILTNSSSTGNSKLAVFLATSSTSVKPKLKEPSITLISLDLPRTFPALSFFQVGGPLHHDLRRILEAFVCFRPELGYVQGMSYVAACLLLYLEEYPAYQCLCNILNTEILTSFYSMNIDKIDVYIRTFEYLLAARLPEVSKHLKKYNVTPHVFLIDW
eukprot:TRINITY_DN7880_c0_g1_i2.p1 TRINITY_DN7880_c0_g1~~TRINITY_DN7880_c0_g1_i2.p1  ORF type:complete len:500 (+),score=110.62 TRINITY_DN7880_c0_g1_i2:195-1502(+)